MRLFYQETVHKMLAKFPFRDPVLSDLVHKMLAKFRFRHAVLTDLGLLDPRQREKYHQLQHIF